MSRTEVLTYPFPGTSYFGSAHHDFSTIIPSTKDVSKLPVNIDVPGEQVAGSLRKLTSVRSDALDRINPLSEKLEGPLGQVDISVADEPIIKPERTNQRAPPILSNVFWAYLVIIIIVAIIIFVFVWNDQQSGGFSWYDSLSKPVELPIFTLYIIWLFFFIVWLITAYITYLQAPDNNKKLLLLWAFILNMISIVLWGFFLFSQRNLAACIYIALLNLVLATWWLYLVWTVNSLLAIMNVLYIAWLVFLIWFQVNLRSRLVNF